MLQHFPRAGDVAAGRAGFDASQTAEVFSGRLQQFTACLHHAAHESRSHIANLVGDRAQRPLLQHFRIDTGRAGFLRIQMVSDFFDVCRGRRARDFDSIRLAGARARDFKNGHGGDVGSLTISKA